MTNPATIPSTLSFSTSSSGIINTDSKAITVTTAALTTAARPIYPNHVNRIHKANKATCIITNGNNNLSTMSKTSTTITITTTTTSATVTPTTISSQRTTAATNFISQLHQQQQKQYHQQPQQQQQQQQHNYNYNHNLSINNNNNIINNNNKNNNNNNINNNDNTMMIMTTAKHNTTKPPLLPKPKTPSFDKDRDYIGFATLPEQVHRKSVKRGFEFTLMVVGESGLGKSTLINSLFLGDLYKNRVIPNVEERIEKTTRVEKKTMDIEERGVRLRLTVIDTPGFGDAINCEDSWRVCTAYIDEQFRHYFTDESGLNRRNIQDNRVHCCLYFVPPWGHSLRQMDLDMIKRLQRKVNIVLVIGKADCLTKSEVRNLKERILRDLDEHHIQLYQFPECDSDEDDDFKQQDRELKASIPFAVVGSNTILDIAGKKVRGRQYPWGVVNVEDPEHSDFHKLRTFLISTHMQDLKDTTQDVHYENFRAQCISQISQHALRERGKLKRDSISSTNGFEMAITETDRLLLQKDEEIRRMQDMLTQMQEKLKQTHLMEMKKNDTVIDV